MILQEKINLQEKREKISSMVLQGLCSNPWSILRNWESLVEDALKVTDILIAELENKE